MLRKSYVRNVLIGLPYSDYLDQLCLVLYDLLRPHIIHSNHLETLSELCFILRVEMIDEHVKQNRKLSSFR